MGHDDSQLMTAGAAHAATGQGSGVATSAIFVLGMHRSGTSAVAALLASMGACTGDESELLPSHPYDNPEGYWERGDVVAANDELLCATGHSWQRVAAFDAAEIPPSARRNFEQRMRRLIERLDAQGKPWLLKDPRLCLLLPFWLTLAPDAACVVVVRDPRQIAASLRDTPRGVLTSEFPLLLWEKYLSCLLDELAGRRALFVSYDALLEEAPAQLPRLQSSLELLGRSGLTSQPPTGALDAKLRRSTVDAHVELSNSQTALYDWLVAQTRAPGPVQVADYPRARPPDQALAEFEAAFDHHIERGRAEGRNATGMQLDRIEQALTQHSVEREHWRAELKRQHERALQLTQAIASAEAQRDAAQSEAQTLRHSAEHNVELQQQVESLRHELQALLQHTSTLQAHVADLQQGAHALHSSWSWKITAPLRGVATLFNVAFDTRSEQRLYRLYYAIPGLNVARKRAAVLWLHQHLPWLTRRTLSYRLYEQTQELVRQRTSDPELRKKLQRMDAERAAALVATIQDPPLISIVMPVYNVAAELLGQAVDSVRRQFYPHWELCIADDASTHASTRAALEWIAQIGDARIKLRRLERNSGIAGASNAALELATGSFVGLLDNDDALTRDALLEVALRIRSDDADLIYSDEDKLDEGGVNVEPHFKPDYNEDYFLAINYICHFSVIRRELLQQIGGFRTGFDGAQDYDLLLRVTERTRRIAHIPKVLYHWRRTSGSTAVNASAKPQTSEAGRRALAESLARRGIDARVCEGPFPNTYRVTRGIQGKPLVSLLIPFRDKPELLEACISSILAKTSYQRFEIIGIDNNSSEASTQRVMQALQARDSRVRFVRYEAPFNYSAINNFGATQARGEHLLFLNNDTEVLDSGWLEALLAHSQRRNVGVVGAKLLYSDDTIQHSGVIVGVGGVAGHAHLFLPADAPGYFSRAQLAQNLSAVTFACAMTRREVFERVGGLNDKELRIAFNDVDYCLRVREAGYLIVYTPDAVLHHYESKSRGYEDTPEKQTRFAGEIRYMQQRHDAVLRDGDPYYNPNLSLTNCYQPDPGYADALPL